MRGRRVIIVAILSLGIAANMAVLAIVYAVLMRPLPHPSPERLVAIWSTELASGREHQTAPLDFFDLERMSFSFEHLGAYYPPGFTLTGAPGAERVGGARATAGLFDVFGVRPILGRGFRPDEDRPGAARVAIISHRLWTRRFASDATIIGRTITLSGAPYTAVGVLPDGFDTAAMWPRTPDVWVPLGLDPNAGRRDARMLRVLGRMRPGVTVERANADLQRIAAGLSATYPETRIGVVVKPLLQELTKEARPSLRMLLLAVAALLCVAVGNVAALILAGTVRRQHEWWTRLALGATRGDLVRQIVREHIALGIVSAAGGSALAYLTSDLLRAIAATAGFPRASEIHIDGATVTAGVALSLLSIIVSAVVGGSSTVRRAAEFGLVRDARSLTRSHRRAHSALLALETALSLALLAGAGLLVRSFYELRSVDPGFDTARTFGLRVSPPAARYPAGPVLAGFYDRLVDRVRTVPGVQTVAVADWLPATGTGQSIGFKADRADSGRHLAEWRVVSDDYFATLAIPLLAGRSFEPRDDDAAPRVAIVNESLARGFFGTVNVVGRTITLDRGGPIDAEIIGVTKDVRELSRRLAAAPGMYLPKRQRPWLATETRELIVRAADGASPAAVDIQRAVRELEPDVPLGPFERLSEATSLPTVRAELYASAAAILAGIALLLAAFGVYGAVSFAVAARARDIGISIALGATPRQVITETTLHGLRPIAVGLLAGLPLAIAAGYAARQQLFGVEATDAPTLGAVAAIMIAVAIVASAFPAIRAAKVSPATVLRAEAP